MQLTKIKFSRCKGKDTEWSIEGKPDHEKFNQWFSLNNMNLIVGKNASGKTRTIEAIRHLADLLSGEVKLSELNLLGYGTAEYKVQFNDDGSKVEYYLDFQEGAVTQEKLIIDKQEKLNRAEKKLWYEEIGNYLELEIDANILATSNKNKKQHPFFEKMYSWGKHLNHYKFGTQLGKNALLKDISLITDEHKFDLKSGDEVTGVFISGKRKFGNQFTDIICDEMKRIGYDLKKIEVSPLQIIPAYGLNVQESDLLGITDQREMSQGMFRALSLLIQLNYALLSQTSSCILIDDIGEGLDYDRSKSLIDLIVEKVKSSPVQVIMTTNNRFIMNKVPLEYWSVIQRLPKKSLFYNYQNSKEVFEEFEYTGLSNFDFLSSEFYIAGFDSES